MYIVTGASKNVGRYLFTQLKAKGKQVIGFYNSTFNGFEEDSELYSVLYQPYYKKLQSCQKETRRAVAKLVYRDV